MPDIGLISIAAATIGLEDEEGACFSLELLSISSTGWNSTLALLTAVRQPTNWQSSLSKSISNETRGPRRVTQSSYSWREKRHLAASWNAETKSIKSPLDNVLFSEFCKESKSDVNNVADKSCVLCADSRPLCSKAARHRLGWFCK